MGTAAVRAERTAWVLARWPAAAGLLTAVERERAGRFRSAPDADDFVAAHALVRICAADLLGTDPARLTVTQRCPVCGGPHGPPALAEEPALHVSLSHTRGHVAAAAGTGRIGVDIERAGLDGSDLDGVLSAAERHLVAGADHPSATFTGVWVRKEALVKAGEASLDRLADIDVTAYPATARHPATGLYLRHWRAGSGVAVGCAATDPPDMASDSLALALAGPDPAAGHGSAVGTEG